MIWIQNRGIVKRSFLTSKSDACGRQTAIFPPKVSQDKPFSFLDPTYEYKWNDKRPNFPVNVKTTWLIFNLFTTITKQKNLSLIKFDNIGTSSPKHLHKHHSVNI